MENAPLLIVLPSRADRTLVTDAHNSEGYQVQLKPFDSVEVETVIRTAILHAEAPVRDLVTPSGRPVILALQAAQDRPILLTVR
jgi:hypothetical protein